MKYLAARFISSCLVAFSFFVVVQDKRGDLRKGFKNPPAEACPRVWWHWMDANISEEGI
jgi:hypothetical protein